MRPCNRLENIMIKHFLKRLRARYRVPGSVERHVIERAHSVDLGFVGGHTSVDVAIEHEAIGGSKRIAAQAATDAARARLGAPQFGF